MSNHFISNKKKFFDLWAPSYDWLFLSVFYQAVHKRLLEYVYLPDQPYVLDLGCGYGEFINNVSCTKKFAMDLNPTARRGAPGGALRQGAAGGPAARGRPARLCAANAPCQR